MAKFTEQLSYRLNYLRRLVVETPFYGWIIILSVAAGFSNFLGLPALVPILDYLQKGEGASPAAGPILGAVERFFLSVGITPGFHSMLAAAAGLILLGEMLVAIGTLVALFASYRLIERYSKRVLDLYTRVEWRWLLGSNSGEINYVVLKEAELAAACHLNAQRVLISLIQCVVYFALAVRISPSSVVLAVVIYAILGVANMANAHAIRRITDRFNVAYKKLSTVVAGLQQNKKFLKTSMLNSRISVKVDQQLSSICQFYRSIGTRTQLQYSWNFAVMFLFLISLIVFYKQFGFQYSSLLVLVLIFNRLAPQFNALSTAYAALNNYLPMHKALNQRLADMNVHLEQSGQRPFDPSCAIRFDRVCFGYQASTPILKDVSLDIQPRQTTAIVGRSGSGKTTLLDLLLGLLTPNSGALYYGAVKHADLDLATLRAKVAYISQQPTMLDGTLRENLLIGAPDAGDHKLQEICKKAHIDQFIDSLSQGLDTVVGENGVKLSGGQKQRVVLARALLMKPSVLILDEATSELDLESEKMIQATIRDLSRELTIIIVAHRLSTVRQADRVFVLEDGMICESGTYDELLARKGKLYFLDSLQK